ncbi:MAG: HAMP domain-containing sensor histidine kinase [Limnoraphis robusta]
MMLNPMLSKQEFIGDVNHCLYQELEQLRRENTTLKNRLEKISQFHPIVLKLSPFSIESEMSGSDVTVNLVNEPLFNNISLALSTTLTQQELLQTPINFSFNYSPGSCVEPTSNSANENLYRRTLALEHLIRQQTQNQSNLKCRIQQITETAAHTLEAVEKISLYLYPQNHQFSELESLFNVNINLGNGQKTDPVCLHLYDCLTHYHYTHLEPNTIATPQPNYLGECPLEFAWGSIKPTLNSKEYSRLFSDFSNSVHRSNQLNVLDIPLKLAEEKIGYLRIERGNITDDWTKEEESFLECLAHLVSLTLERFKSQYLEKKWSREQEQLQVQLEQKTATLQQTTQKLRSQISERQKLELSLQDARHSAQTALRAKRAFLANINHELRTPVHAVIGYSDLLCEEMVEQGQINWLEDMQIIRREGYRLLNLIDSILDLVRIEAGQMSLNLEIFDPVNVIKGVVKSLESMAEKNRNQLKLSYGNDLGLMHTDLSKLQKILHHLLENALKFTEGGEIELTACRQGDWIDFYLQDNGIGISVEQQHCLFEAFTQADDSLCRKYGGTGLGLTICRRLCKMIGGDITVSSQLGQGSTFVVRLKAHLDDTVQYQAG